MPRPKLLSLALSLPLALLAILPGAVAAQDAASERSVMRAQVLLDRARFSPGPIDGRMGSNTEKAVRALQQAAGLETSGGLDQPTWDELEVRAGGDVTALIDYTISKDDIDGPFVDSIPDDMQKMAKLDRLAYTGPAELLAEKFHMDLEVLKRLNKGKSLRKAGTTIRVANIERGKAPKAARIEVDKEVDAVRVFDESNRVIAFYPATIGSTETPSPSGTVKVKGVARNPTYRYDPKKLDFEGVDAKKPFNIAPGPNNPVGSVWIELAKDGYGIHGSPEPDAISRQQSHGCVRLTNWDALDLAEMVAPGLEVAFVGEDGRAMAE
jgi:lipoprotein-anchoring transpeptidase ErfK/SrfK